jgi:hypothetical protein
VNQHSRAAGSDKHPDPLRLLKPFAELELPATGAVVREKESIMRAGSIVTVAVLAFLVTGAVAFAYFGLSEPGRPMSAQIFVALILGSILSLGIGVGLMALLFYSHRKGYGGPGLLLSPSEPETR